MTPFLNYTVTDDSSNESQIQIVHRYLKTHTATASMVEAATGVHQKCITRYKSTLQKAGVLYEIKKGICRRTGRKAMYLTCDPAQVPANLQMKLF